MTGAVIFHAWDVTLLKQPTLVRRGRQKWILLSTGEERLPGLGRFLFLSFSLRSILIYILLPMVGKKKHQKTLLVLPGNVFY